MAGARSFSTEEWLTKVRMVAMAVCIWLRKSPKLQGCAVMFIRNGNKRHSVSSNFFVVHSVNSIHEYTEETARPLQYLY